MSFKDIKGQDSALSFLKSSIAGDRVAQAYIFHGPKGIGKRMVAIEFAKALNCVAGGNDVPCDACIPCKKIDTSNHPDVFITDVDEAGSSIKIDAVRDLIRNISLKPYEGKKKVYVIDNAESLTPQASHALLKTLEEPVSSAVIILITDRLNLLLPTIRSRSQPVRFYSLGIDEVRSILTRDHEVEGVKAHILANVASGRLGQALAYNTDDFFMMRSRIMDNASHGIFFGDLMDKISKDDLLQYLDIMLTWYRDILVVKADADNNKRIVNVDRAEAISGMAKKMTFEHLTEMIYSIISIGTDVQRSANPRLALAVLGIKVKAS